MSVRKTGRVIILEEASKQGSVGADIASRLAENEFDELDAPIVRLGARHVLPCNHRPQLGPRVVARARLQDRKTSRFVSSKVGSSVACVSGRG